MQSVVDAPLFHIVLVTPEIPQNTGSIGRLCLATGCRLHLVRPLGFSIDEKAVRRAGLDYWKEVDLMVHESLEEALAVLEGHPVSFTSARHGQRYVDHPFSQGQVLVFGRESTGLPSWVHARHPDRFLRIPTLNAVRSLNLSNAVSVVVYEGVRQVGVWNTFE